MHTIKSLTTMIIERDELPQSKRDGINRLLRWFRSKEYIRPSKESGGQGREGEFDEDNAARALLLHVLYSLDMNGEATKEALNVLERNSVGMPKGERSGPKMISHRMNDILAGLRAGDEWAMKFRPTPRGLRATVIPPENKRAASEPFDTVAAGTVVIDLRIALSPLVDAEA